MRKILLGTALACVLTISPWSIAEAQLAAMGEKGIAMGHVHVTARDVDAMRSFFIALGGVPVQNGTLQLVQFPGVFVQIRQGESTGGMVGSTVNHFGFLVKNLKESRAKWDAAGIPWQQTDDPVQGYINTTDGLRIEILEDPTIATPIKMHHVHFFNTAPPKDVQAWYAQTFGAVAGTRANFDAADLPGVNLTFTGSKTPVTGTKGRALDHIGFEVKNLEQFIKTLEGRGIKFDRGYTKLPNSNTAIAFLTDPWGTYVELTENLGPAQ